MRAGCAWRSPRSSGLISCGIHPRGSSRTIGVRINAAGERPCINSGNWTPARGAWAFLCAAARAASSAAARRRPGTRTAAVAGDVDGEMGRVVEYEAYKRSPPGVQTRARAAQYIRIESRLPPALLISPALSVDAYTPRANDRPSTETRGWSLLPLMLSGLR